MVWSPLPNQDNVRRLVSQLDTSSKNSLFQVSTDGNLQITLHTKTTKYAHSIRHVYLLIAKRLKYNFNLLFFIYYKHVFNKYIYLKYFKHTIKYNVSSLNILKSSKSSRSTISPFLMMTKPLSLLLTICTIVNKHAMYF